MFLFKGSRGPEVKDLQARLNRLRFGPLEEDGIFGEATASAVRVFQQAAQIGIDAVVGPETWVELEMRAPLGGEGVPSSITQLLLCLEMKGYSVHQDGQCNIVGVRSNSRDANAFDDFIHLLWTSDGTWNHRAYTATTDPGIAWLEEPGREAGTAILCPGQYPVYRWDMHARKYLTLCQRAGMVKVYRDSNRDNVLNMEARSVEEGWYGINIHHAGKDSTQVDRWSAGCQVFKRLADWEEAVRIWKATGADLFTYTLILEGDLSRA
jgi:hypothetical protein